LPGFPILNLIHLVPVILVLPGHPSIRKQQVLA
jgi:hypothetical protein